MLSERTNGAATDELLHAAAAVQEVDHGAGVLALPDELEALAEALRDAGSALVTSASRVVPPAKPEHDHSICGRYQRAAASWPTAPPPSHEGFAGALGRLHEAADATRLAARRCDEARRAVQALLRTARLSCTAMSYEPTQAVIGPLPRGAAGWRLTRIRAALRRRRLDAALAQGADPWSAGRPRSARAARLGSYTERRAIAAGLTALLDLAAFQQRRTSPHVVRHQLVLEHRESLRALSERLALPEPVDVAVVAQLELLLIDPASPVYTRGADPHRLAEVTSRCLDRAAG